MAEIAIPEPLSGTEIVEAVMFRVRQHLMQDCFLNSTAAYESFEGNIRIELRAVDCGRVAEIIQDSPVTSGIPIDPTKEGFVESTVASDITREPPNVVRRESEQPVPVLTEDSSGRKEVKRVKYQRKGGTKATVKK